MTVRELLDVLNALPDEVKDSAALARVLGYNSEVVALEVLPLKLRRKTYYSVCLCSPSGLTQENRPRRMKVYKPPA